jgi:hypothetical protein
MMFRNVAPLSPVPRTADAAATALPVTARQFEPALPKAKRSLSAMPQRQTD